MARFPPKSQQGPPPGTCPEPDVGNVSPERRPKDREKLIVTRLSLILQRIHTFRILSFSHSNSNSQLTELHLETFHTSAGLLLHQAHRFVAPSYIKLFLTFHIHNCNCITFTFQIVPRRPWGRGHVRVLSSSCSCANARSSIGVRWSSRVA